MSSAVELYNQGVGHMQDENLTLAREAFDAAIEMEPAFADAYNARAVIGALDGDFNEAIADAHEAIRLHPTGGRFYRTRALIYREMGDEDKATEDLIRSEDLKGDEQ